MTFQKIVLPAPTLPQLDVPDHLPELIDCSDLDDDDDASCTEELDDEADQQDRGGSRGGVEGVATPPFEQHVNFF